MTGVFLLVKLFVSVRVYEWYDGARAEVELDFPSEFMNTDAKYSNNSKVLLPMHAHDRTWHQPDE